MTLSLESINDEQSTTLHTCPYLSLCVSLTFSLPNQNQCAERFYAGVLKHPGVEFRGCVNSDEKQIAPSFSLAYSWNSFPSVVMETTRHGGIAGPWLFAVAVTDTSTAHVGRNLRVLFVLIVGG